MRAASNLFTRQQTSEANGMKYEPHPQIGPDLAALIDTFKIQIAGNPKSESRKYSTIDAADGGEDEHRKRQKATGLKNRPIASWFHFMMMRGENIRFAKLPHINFHAFSDLNSPIMIKDSN
ncbi:hypothetical protein BGZ47_000278 [Haplosporangium gracile]|nr:hypothetical protein BGZ47_000278 [Haplosporangium gracile]